MFKNSWEKINLSYQLSKDMVEEMVCLVDPHKKVLSHSFIAGGCANLNYKIQLEHKNQPLILRVYLRDKDAAYREQTLTALLKKDLPVPLTYAIGELAGQHFALTEYMPGVTLRDLLLSDTSPDISTLMDAVGRMLSKLIVHPFSSAEFLNQEWKVISYVPSDVITFAQDCLNDSRVLSMLSPEVISGIQKTIEQYAYLFPTGNERCLVHGDFDPANILVDKINGSWAVTGVLDWEFAFLGSYLWDVANMLRYDHKMPSEFQNAFIGGLKRSGIHLPSTWPTTIHLLNLCSLLDCLKRSDPKRQPQRCIDIRELIAFIVLTLKSHD